MEIKKHLARLACWLLTGETLLLRKIQIDENDNRFKPALKVKKEQADFTETTD